MFLHFWAHAQKTCAHGSHTYDRTHKETNKHRHTQISLSRSRSWVSLFDSLWLGDCHKLSSGLVQNLKWSPELVRKFVYSFAEFREGKSECGTPAASTWKIVQSLTSRQAERKREIEGDFLKWMAVQIWVEAHCCRWTQHSKKKKQDRAWHIEADVSMNPRNCAWLLVNIGYILIANEMQRKRMAWNDRPQLQARHRSAKRVRTRLFNCCQIFWREQ